MTLLTLTVVGIKACVSSGALFCGELTDVIVFYVNSNGDSVDFDFPSIRKIRNP